MKPSTVQELPDLVRSSASVRVGSVSAEYHGRAVWDISHPDFVDPGEPRTIERLDDALYKAGFEIMPDD